MKYGNYKTIKNIQSKAAGWPDLHMHDIQVKGGYMNEQQQMEERLWDYIDGLSSPAEQSVIDQLITARLEWKNKYRELLEVQQLMNSSDLDAPSLRFTKNVMEDIAKYQVAPATNSYINKKIIWGIGGFFLLMLVGFLVYAFAQANWSGSGSSDLLSQYHLDKKIDWSKIFNNSYTSVFMMINVVLGLILLDMYLQRKKGLDAHKETR